MLNPSLPSLPPSAERVAEIFILIWSSLPATMRQDAVVELEKMAVTDRSNDSIGSAVRAAKMLNTAIDRVVPTALA